MISDVIDIAKAVGTLTATGGKVIDVGSKVASSVADSKAAIMSIAEKSRKSVMMYKVWMSASIRETELAKDINKWLENMYSIFTMLILGYNPMAKDNTELHGIIGGISAESFKPDYNTKTQESAYQKAMVILDGERKLSSPRIGRGYKSEEAKKPSITSVPDGNTIKGYDGNIGDLRNAAVRDANVASEAHFISYLKDLDTKSYPTIVKMNVNVRGTTISIPLAVKCNVYPMGSEETRLLIESGISGKMFDYLRKIKWRSGEISTLAWIFNTDIAEKSKTLYAKLGRNPMFVELQQRKAAAKRSFWGKFLSRFGAEYSTDDDQKGAYNTINAAIANVPPTSSLIVSKDDLVAATRLNIEHFTKNEGFVNRFMRDNFLLCLGIVDHATQEFTCFMMGYKQPFKLSFDELTKSNSQGQDKTMSDIIKILATKV